MTTRIKAVRAKSGTPAQRKLTAYESEQIGEIAAWKSQPPNPFGEIVRKITLPGAKLVERVLPDSLVRVATDQSFELAVRLAGKEDVKVRSGVRDLRELLKKPLEECDRLAFQTGVFSQVFATVEGVATGAGGILTTFVDIPLLFILSLRTILKIGHCYGYPLDGQRDQHFVLGVLIAATSGTLETRRRRLDRLHQLQNWLIEETQGEIVAEEVLSILFQLEIFGGVPGMGAVSGALLNMWFMRKIDNTARRVFQERWLRDNGKVRLIAPAPAHSRDLATGWSGALGRAAYSACYCAGFGVALPASVLRSLFGSMDNAMMQGIRDGADDARRGLDLMLSEAAPRRRSPRRGQAAAIA